MAEADDLLPAKLCRRSWLLWIALMVASLLWRSQEIFFGVAAGGLISIGSFYWLRWSLTRLLSCTTGQRSGRHLVSVLLRLLVLGVLLFLLIGPAQVSPPALVAGLSVVVISILGLALERVIKGRICIS